MWRIYKKLFGWDYVIVMYAYDWEIVRLKSFPNGVIYYKLNGKIKLLDDARLWKKIT